MVLICLSILLILQAGSGHVNNRKTEINIAHQIQHQGHGVLVIGYDDNQHLLK